MVAAGVLRGLRRRLRLTQDELARMTGLPQSVISAYETGAREPSVGALVRLIEATGHELRLNVVPADRHDEILAATTPPDTLRAFRAEQAAYASGRRADILANDVFADVLAALDPRA